jgi:glucose-1-phosphate adenylyltransferase
VSGAHVENSLLFSYCQVEPYSFVSESVVLPDVRIGEHCRISRAIIDRGSMIEDGTIIGENHDDDRDRGFRVTDEGLTLVTPAMLGQDLHFTR